MVAGDRDVVQGKRSAIVDATPVRIQPRVSVLNRQVGDRGIGEDIENAINLVAVDDRHRGTRSVDGQHAAVDRVVDVEVARGRTILVLPGNGEGVGLGLEVDDIGPPQGVGFLDRGS